jgi:hypothetical protein
VDSTARQNSTPFSTDSPPNNGQSRPSIVEAADSTISTSNTPPLGETQSSPEFVQAAVSTGRANTSAKRSPATSETFSDNASPEGTQDVFNEYMCDSITTHTIQIDEMTYPKADVTMDFPSQGLVDCLMSLAIHESRVKYFAEVLFNAKVESDGDVRYVILPGGAILTPAPEVSLKGVPDEAIVLGFGHMIYDAVASSRGRKEELERGRRDTHGVSMILSRNSGDGAVINLSLEAKRGAKIHDKLYT